MTLTASVSHGGVKLGNDDDRVLLKGEKAPHLGVLVPEVNYRDFVNAKNTQIDYYQRISEVERLKISIEKQENTWYKYFVYGALIGIATTIAVNP